MISGKGFMQMSIISVVLCTYNGEKYIKRQIETILEQNPAPDEIIISDDGSTDGTLSIVNELLAGEQDCKYIINRNQMNLGFVKNFQKALMLSEGDFIFFSDQDDEWMPNKTKTILAFFDDNPDIEMVFSDGRTIDSNGEELDCNLWNSFGFGEKKQLREFHQNPLKFLLGKNIVTGATIAIRRSLINCIIPFPTELVHDTWISYIAAIRGTLGIIELPLIRYRVHSNQTIGIKHGIKDSALLKTDKTEEKCRLDKIYQYAKTNKYENESSLIKGKMDFYMSRDTLKSYGMFKRIAVVAGNWRNYYAYASGLYSMIKDIFIV